MPNTAYPALGTKGEVNFFQDLEDKKARALFDKKKETNGRKKTGPDHETTLKKDREKVTKKPANSHKSLSVFDRGSYVSPFDQFILKQPGSKSDSNDFGVINSRNEPTSQEFRTFDVRDILGPLRPS